ncbi:MAG: BrnA antitoxin family protein [Oscillospiraceae bacterium]|nr:BrnA antitoxin family protein [Oscillospiraceae bacterium]
MAMISMNMNNIGMELTEEEIMEIEAAALRPPVFDEDSPEMTEAMLKQFKRVRQETRTKQTASIRLSPKAQSFSRAYGKGYTSFLSRLIDAALDDETLVKKCI